MSIQRIGNRRRAALGKHQSGSTARSLGTGSTTSSIPTLAPKMTGCFPRPDSVPWGLQRESNSHEEVVVNVRKQHSGRCCYYHELFRLSIVVMGAGTYGSSFPLNWFITLQQQPSSILAPQVAFQASLPPQQTKTSDAPTGKHRRCAHAGLYNYLQRVHWERLVWKSSERLSRVYACY